MERKVYGTITFNVEMLMETHDAELSDYLLERAKTVCEDMDVDILLRKLLHDSTVEVELEEVEFNEAD
jgi:hypothetical protein